MLSPQEHQQSQSCHPWLGILNWSQFYLCSLQFGLQHTNTYRRVWLCFHPTFFRNKSKMRVACDAVSRWAYTSVERPVAWLITLTALVWSKTVPSSATLTLRAFFTLLVDVFEIDDATGLLEAALVSLAALDSPVIRFIAVMNNTKVLSSVTSITLSELAPRRVATS